MVFIALSCDLTLETVASIDLKVEDIKADMATTSALFFRAV